MRKSRQEMEKITYRLSVFAKNAQIDFDTAVLYLSAKCGYKKYEYIPCDNDMLFSISNLAYRYIKTYSINPSDFFAGIKACKQYCDKYGFSQDVMQKTLDWVG